MLTQAEKGSAFRALHYRKDAFIIPNPWDIGTARLLAHLGFEALATTSAGYAFSVGQQDNTIGRDQMLTHVSALAAATDLPVSGDLENGFGDAPETVAETIGLAAAAGLVGGSIEAHKARLRAAIKPRNSPVLRAERLIPGLLCACSSEDATGRPDQPIYHQENAVERIRAAAEAVRSLPFTFTLTARAENYLVGHPDLGDTVQRLQAYGEAGADVLYAPGLTKEEDIAEVVRSVSRPVNVLMGLQGVHLNHDALSELGVKRISVGSALSRAALGAFLKAAREMKEHGTFAFADYALSYRELSALFKN